MNLRKRALLFASVAFAAFALLFIQLAPTDPIISGKCASAWASDLLSPDYKQRGDAQSALLAAGPAAVPQIRVLLRKDTPFWQPYLRRLPSFPFLLADGPDPILCRRRGAEMIALLQTKGASAIPELIDTLRFPEGTLDAEYALLRIGDASVRPLIEALHSRHNEIRDGAARLLKEFPAHQSEFVVSLIAATRDSSPKVRRSAALTLGACSCHKDEIITALLRLRNDEAIEARAAACESLGKLEATAAEVISALKDSLRDPAPLVQLEAAKSLWLLTHDADAAVPVLCAILPTAAGWQAAYALGNIGPAAAAAVPALIQVLRREKVPRAFRTPPSSSFALGQIQEPAIPALEDVLQEEQPAVRLAALLAFNSMGTHARPAIPALQKLLRDPEREIRDIAAITLASAGADRSIILASLTDCLEAEDIYLRSTAAALLRQIAPEQDWAVLPE